MQSSVPYKQHSFIDRASAVFAPELALPSGKDTLRHPQLNVSQQQLRNTNRTFGKAALVPGRLLGYPNTLALARLSGTSSTVPSTAITRNPPKNALGVSGVAKGRTTRTG